MISSLVVFIYYKNMSMQYILIFFNAAVEMTIFKWKMIFFLIGAQNIDCGYLLELSEWDSSSRIPTLYVYSKK